MEGGETILYVNKFYEKNLTTTVVTTSYYLGGTLVAQREDTTLRYAHQDHLSGTSLMTDTNGNSLGTMKYYPYGSTRSGSVPTDELFTGQKLDGTGLYYYGARYYDPMIGRFISPDTIIPNPVDPQSFNRYSYCLNNPLKYNDPSGHVAAIYGINVNDIESTLTNSGMPLPDSVTNMFMIKYAWDSIASVTPEITDYIEDAEETYNIMYDDIEKGGEYSSQNRVIKINNNSSSSAGCTIATLSHEIAHLIEGTSERSLFEEVVAYQFEYYICDELGYNIAHPGLPLDNALKTDLWPYETNEQDEYLDDIVRGDWVGTSYAKYPTYPNSGTPWSLMAWIVVPYLIVDLN